MSTKDFSGSAVTTVTATTVDVSIFKDKDGQSNPRVVADSQHFIVYSLKKASSLRVLARPNNIQATFKNHTTDVTGCKFVNYSSNVVASASEGQFFVWCIKKESNDTLSTPVYFTITEPITIRSFSWFLDTKTKYPELLILHGTTAMQFSSSTLMINYVDTTLQATVAEHGLPFERSVSTTANFTSVAEGLFAFSVDESSIVVCTARNANVPPWSPCERQTLLGVELLQDQSSTLVAACSSFVAVWRVGEKTPSLLHKLVFGAPVVQMASAFSTLSVFTESQCCFLVDTAGGNVGKAVKVDTAYVVPGANRALSFCMMNASLFSFLVDIGSKLVLTQIPVPKTVQPPPPRSAPVAPPPQYVSPKNTFVPPPVQAVASMPLPRPVAPQQPAVQLTNPALPQLARDGQIAQTLDQCTQEVAELQQRLNSALDNVTQIVQLVPHNVRKDHVSLVSLSLEAQMTELQAAKVTVGGAGAAAASVNNGFESHFVAELLDNVASGLVEGIVPGIHQALLSELEPSLRSAVVQQLKKSQKDVFKQRIDAVLRNVAQEFIAELEKKQKAHEGTFRKFGSGVRYSSEAAMQRMAQTIVTLEDQLNFFTQSGILEELRSLRAEVQRLREQAAGAVATSTAAINPVTIVAAVRELFEREGAVAGLHYLARVGHSEVTMQFLSEIAEDETLRDAALEVKETDVWLNILSHLMSATKVNQLKVALQWMEDVLGEQDELTNNVVLKSSLRNFVRTWKDEAKKDAELTQKLRSIEIRVK